jgi:hypothetical protein
MSDLEKRIAAIEAKINRGGNGTPSFEIVLVEGCLPVGPPKWSYAGDHRWQRDPEESLEQFVQRSAEAAMAAGEKLLKVGGLPHDTEWHDLYPDFESFWRAECAPHYSDVPPEEELHRSRY